MPRPEVLAGQPNRNAFGQQRAESQRLSGRPVYSLAGLDHLAARVQQPYQLTVDVEAIRIGVERATDVAQHLLGDPGLVIAQLLLADQRLQAGPLALQPIRDVRLILRRGLERLLQLLANLGRDRVDIFLRQRLLADQLVGVNLASRRLSGDRLVHDRLGKRGLVRLVVAEAAIAEHVDDDVALELLPELGGDAGDVHHRFGVVAIDVEDRRLDHLRHIR